MFLATKLLQLDFQINIYYTDSDYWSAQIAKRGSCKRQIAVFFEFVRKNYFFIIKIFLKIATRLWQRYYQIFCWRL